MKRLLSCLFCILLLFGCASEPHSNVYEHSLFTVSLPDTFEPAETGSLICFAPYGDPLHSSSITYYTTELNPYFDTFTDEEYENALRQECGYESLTLESVETVTVDGYRAKRIACKVAIDQGTHDLIVYSIHADRTYFFTLLNRDGDSFVEAFDSMMRSLQFTNK